LFGHFAVIPSTSPTFDKSPEGNPAFVELLVSGWAAAPTRRMKQRKRRSSGGTWAEQK